MSYLAQSLGGCQMTLKPCPFCGGESKIFEVYYSSWIVACTNCCCRTHAEDTVGDAIKIWNRRVRV